MDRRTFVGTSTLLAAGTLLDAARDDARAQATGTALPTTPGDPPMIGIQVGAVAAGALNETKLH
jgi:hypothetical protein